MKILLLLTSLLITISMHAETLEVHVTSAKSPEGFVVSQRVEESARDIRTILNDKNHKKTYKLVDKAEDADLILEVTFSGPVAAGTETQIVRGPLGTPIARTAPAPLPGLIVLLKTQSNPHVREFSHVQQLFWKDLAKRIVKQFDQWVKANAQTLANRTQKELVSPR